MDCRQVQDELLHSDDPRAALSDAHMGPHLSGCAACRVLAQQLVALEDAWRSLPVPPDAEPSKQAFLSRLAPTERPPPNASPARRGRWRPRRHVLEWCAGAAASLSILVAGVWFFLGGTAGLEADDDPIERLVDWNLRVTQTPSETERQRLCEEEIAQWQTMLSKSRLPEEQRALAVALVENGKWLAANKDPLSAADRFDTLADQLLQQAQAGSAGNQRRTSRLLAQYDRILETGVSQNVERVDPAGTLNVENQQKLERLTLGDPQRIQKLESMLDKAPRSAKKPIKHALGLHKKHAEKFRRGKR